MQRAVLAMPLVRRQRVRSSLGAVGALPYAIGPLVVFIVVFIVELIIAIGPRTRVA